LSPITTLTLAHIGKQVRIVDESITLTGTLLAIDAERKQIHESYLCTEGDRLTAGAWENITVTVGPNRVNLHPDAQWEEA
jgi:hypothetical protein